LRSGESPPAPEGFVAALFAQSAKSGGRGRIGVALLHRAFGMTFSFCADACTLAPALLNASSSNLLSGSKTIPFEH